MRPRHFHFLFASATPAPQKSGIDRRRIGLRKFCEIPSTHTHRDTPCSTYERKGILVRSIKDRPLPRPLLCPICKSAVQELDRTGDATGFDCETDGKFKVANTVFADGRVRHYTNQQWEAALRKAKQRTKAGEWPVIKSSDF